MRVFDAHRLLGPVPDDEVASVDATGVLAELDRLGIDATAVTSTARLFGGPRAAGPDAPAATSPRLLDVPVAFPEVPGAGEPADVEALLANEPAMVRACPRRHRFDLLGPIARRWWEGLAAAGVPLALAVDECGLDAIATVARAVPELTVLALTPGYRVLRQLAELLTTFPRVYVETGTIVTAGGVEWLADQVGARRLVFGTGAPVWDDAGPRFQLDRLGLPDTDVALIAGGSFELMRAGEHG